MIIVFAQAFGCIGEKEKRYIPPAKRQGSGWSGGCWRTSDRIAFWAIAVEKVIILPRFDLFYLNSPTVSLL